MIRLACQVQPYSYGKKGSKSLAARYALATPENNFKLDENQEYGEVYTSFWEWTAILNTLHPDLDGRPPQRSL